MGQGHRSLQDRQRRAVSQARRGEQASTTRSYEKYSQRLARLRGIRKYIYRMDVLERSSPTTRSPRSSSASTRSGAKLRSSDLALAQITAKWRNSLKTFEAFQQQCAKAGFDLDLGLHLKNLVAFATGQSRFLTVGSLRVEALQQAGRTAAAGMEFALNFLKSNAGIDSPALAVIAVHAGHARLLRPQA